jgi:glutamyl-tRNA synthetase
MEGASKRKLNKRKDPEAAVSYYHQMGYPIASVTEYLLNLANSGYEDWRRQNPDKPNLDYTLDIKKMSVSGALFDIVKLADMSKDVISKLPAKDVYDSIFLLAQEYDEEFAKLLKEDEEYAINILSIGRGGKKPRKDIAKWSDVRANIEYFYDDVFEADTNYDFPEKIEKENIKIVLENYGKALNMEDDKEQWFEHLKDFAETIGFARDAKTFKKNPDQFKGHVGDVAMVLRVALTKKRNTPDLHEMIGVMGRDRVEKRFTRCNEIL